MPPSPQSSPGTEGDILLVEGYDALSAAISFALKKFAPRHLIRTAASLRATEKLAVQKPSDLLVIDFDPPLAGALASFVRLKTLMPETRTLIIAAGMPRDILRERRQPTALEFIEKPFRLAEFGEAVQALLGVSDEASSPPRGTLRDLNLGDLIPLLCIEGATEILSVKEAGDGRRGEVHFTRGQIQHAVANGLEGIDALREMLGWASPDFAAEAGQTEARHSIEGLWPAILHDVLRSMPATRPHHAGRKPQDAPAVPKRAHKPRPRVVRDGKKVLVVDDTETLRVFVEEMLSTADPRMRIETASNGTDGLSRCGSFRPDLILLDYSLPDINGDEVCRRLLESERTNQIPVIMMSGHVAEMAAAAARYENIVLTLPKPFLSAALNDAVLTILTNPPIFKLPKPIAAPAKIQAKDIEPAATESTQETNGQGLAAGPRSEAAPPVFPSAELTPPLSVAEGATSVLRRSERALSSAHILPVRSRVVVVSISLEVISMTFSPALLITAIRARPTSTTVSLTVDPRVLAAGRPEATFEIARVHPMSATRSIRCRWRQY